MLPKTYLRLSRLMVGMLIGFIASTVWSQTTSFTFQGKLTDAGAAPSGNYDLQFALFDAASGGSQIADAQTLPNVAVASGVFTVVLDFGAAAFSGGDRFLEIGVRPAGSSDAFTILTPRQPVTSTPYAVRSATATVADRATTATGATNFNISGTGIVDGSLAVGTTTPATKLDVAGGNGDAVRGVSTGGGRGVWGESDSWQGVFGKSNTNAGLVGDSNSFYGVFGVTNGASAAGVYGSNNSPSGTGIIGQTTSGTGVYGFSTSNGRGVWGQSDSWQGVYGKSNSQAGVVGDSNSFYGVFGVTSGVNASGIYGSNNAAGGTGIIGQSNGGKGVYGSSSGSGGTGVWGEVNTSGSFGVRGVGGAFNTTGVYGVSNLGQGIGVWGQGDINTGVYGLTNSGTGVYGRSTGTGTAVFAEGNARQSLDKGGFVKAMVFVQANGTIARCYNGNTGASTGTCGFTATRNVFPNGPGYDVDFGFNVEGRFFSATANGAFNRSAQISFVSNNTVSVLCHAPDQDSAHTADADFFLIVY